MTWNYIKFLAINHEKNILKIWNTNLELFQAEGTADGKTSISKIDRFAINKKQKLI